jgi:hypothetical protein
MPRPLELKAKDRKPPALGPEVVVQAAHLSTAADESGLAALISRNGLRDWDKDGLLEQTNTPNTMWLGAAAPNQTLEFEFAQAVPLSAIEVWNYNAEWDTAFGLRQADVSVSTDGITWQTVLHGVDFAEADGRPDYDQPIVLQLKGVTARKVRFENMVTWGNAGKIGLSKVVFHRVTSL